MPIAIKSTIFLMVLCQQVHDISAMLSVKVGQNPSAFARSSQPGPAATLESKNVNSIAFPDSRRLSNKGMRANISPLLAAKDGSEASNQPLKEDNENVEVQEIEKIREFPKEGSVKDETFKSTIASLFRSKYGLELAPEQNQLVNQLVQSLISKYGQPAELVPKAVKLAFALTVKKYIFKHAKDIKMTKKVIEGNKELIPVGNNLENDQVAQKKNSSIKGHQMGLEENGQEKQKKQDSKVNIPELAAMKQKLRSVVGFAASGDNDKAKKELNPLDIGPFRELLHGDEKIGKKLEKEFKQAEELLESAKKMLNESKQNIFSILGTIDGSSKGRL